MINELKIDLQNVETQIDKIHEALNKYWGNDLRVFAELWINCEEGSQNIVKRLENSTYLHDGIVSEHLTLHFNMEKGLNWVIRQECSLENYESMSI